MDPIHYREVSQAKKMKEKFTQKRINDYLGWLRIKYIHLTSFLLKRIVCPFCHKTFNRKITVPDNAGLPDLIIFLPTGKLWAVELKTATGRLSDKQKEWIEYFKKSGFDVDVIKRFDDFSKMLDAKYFKRSKRHANHCN